MAALQPAVDRIRYLVFGGNVRSSPKTITGSKYLILSYDEPIAARNDDGTWCVRTDKYGLFSATTNRHIRAASAALAPFLASYCRDE